MTDLHDDLIPDSTDLRDRMDRAVGQLTAPADRLEHRARRRGRTLRHRRRAASALGGLAAAAVLAAVVVPGLGGGDRPADPGFAQEPTGDVIGGEALPEGVPGFWQMPTREMLRRLRAELPKGVTVTDIALAGTDSEPGESAALAGSLTGTITRRGIQGQGAVNVLLYQPQAPAPTATTTTDANGDTSILVPGGEPSVADRTSCPPGDRAGITDMTILRCTEVHDRSDETVGRILTTRVGALTVREATMTTTDGGLVYVATANTTDDKWSETSPATADEPMLTDDEVLAIAQATTWSTWRPTGG